MALYDVLYPLENYLKRYFDVFKPLDIYLMALYDVLYPLENYLKLYFDIFKPKFKNIH